MRHQIGRCEEGGHGSGRGYYVRDDGIHSVILEDAVVVVVGDNVIDVDV